MVVKGPPKEKPDQSVEGLFDSARAHGAQSGTAEDLARARGEGSAPQQAFSGTARTLDGRVEAGQAGFPASSPHPSRHPHPARYQGSA